MIVDIIFYVFGMILNLVGSLLAPLAFSIPVQFAVAVKYFANYLYVFQAIFPIDTLFKAAKLLIVFFGSLWSLKLILWLYNLKPFGQKVNMPFKDSDNNSGGVFGSDGVYKPSADQLSRSATNTSKGKIF